MAFNLYMFGGYPYDKPCPNNKASVRAEVCKVPCSDSPAQDGEHIKCSPLRAELAMTLIYFSGPPPCSGDDTLMSA